MKKQYLKNLFGVLLAMMVTLTAASSSDKKVKVGMAVQDLSNPTWAGYCQAIKQEVDSKGGSLNFVSCEKQC
jgi:ABC-type sugar transport system substrate-binding protein